MIFFDKKEISDQNNKLYTTKILLLSILLPFISHAFIDALAHFTYHPSESNWSDFVYASWHLFTYVSEAVFAIYFLKLDIRYTIPMLSAVGFDLWDWSIRRPLEKYFEIQNIPSIHWIADGTQSFLFVWWAPSLRNVKLALIVEIIFILILLYYWYKLYSKSSLKNNSSPSSWKQIMILIAIFGTLRLFTLI